MNGKSEAQIFLEQVKKIDLRIKNKLIEKQQWHDLALSITGSMDGERVQATGAKDKMSLAVIACTDMEAEILQEVENLRNEKKKVVQLIEQLYSPMEYNVLHLRYIQHKSLQEIADHYGR